MKRIELDDFLIFIGILLLGAGLAMISIPLALGIIGGLLLVIGLVGAYFKGVKR